MKKLNIKNKKQIKAYLKETRFKAAQKIGKKIGLLFLIAILATGCSSTMDMFGNKDLQISGSEEGIQSFFDGVIGASMAGKSIDNIPNDTPYHQLRRDQTKLRALRIMPKQKGGK